MKPVWMRRVGGDRPGSRHAFKGEPQPGDRALCGQTFGRGRWIRHQLGQRCDNCLNIVLNSKVWIL